MYATHGAPITVRDITTLIARIGLGTIFMAHGWQKFSEWTLPGTADAFAQMGVPAAAIVGPTITFIELIGGALLILGALTPIVGVLLAADMLGAFALVHASAGVFIDGGGWELVAALGLGALMLAAAGPGRLSIDRLLFRRKGGSAHGAQGAHQPSTSHLTPQSSD